MARNDYNHCSSHWANFKFDIAVLIAVSSPHRKDAYRANEYAIERIKEVVPIWKKEIWEDGAEWQGHQRGSHDLATKGED